LDDRDTHYPFKTASPVLSVQREEAIIPREGGGAERKEEGRFKPAQDLLRDAAELPWPSHSCRHARMLIAAIASSPEQSSSGNKVLRAEKKKNTAENQRQAPQCWPVWHSRGIV
jgi:hypothetical protein